MMIQCNKGVLLRTAVFCLYSLLFSPQLQASPLFDSAASNVWTLDTATGKIVAAFSVTGDGTMQWTDKAEQTGADSAVIFYKGGSQSISGLDLSRQELLVNNVQQSLPPLDAALPSTSLVGIDLPLAHPDAGIPGVSIIPASGTYDRTTAVQLHGVAARSSTSPLTLHWQINDGPVQSATAAAPGEDIYHTLHLVADDTYTVAFWAEQGGSVSKPQPQTAVYTIDCEEPLQRDTDGDQIPDLVEVELGLDPLSNDSTLDSDQDGWSDFMELFLGTDPHDAASLPAFSAQDSDKDGCPDYLEKLLLERDPFDNSDGSTGDEPDSCTALAAGLSTVDSDGDGYPDLLEQLRGTDAADPKDYPVARRPFEVEYLVVQGSIFQDAAATEKQTLMEEFTVRDSSWDLLYDQSALSDSEAADTALDTGNLPPGLRLPAGEQLILRARAKTDGRWVVKSWIDSAPDILPGDAASWSVSQGNPLWTTTEEWLTDLKKYLAASLVQERTVTMSPASGLGVALVEGIIAWYAGLSDGEALVLLGHDAGPAPKSAVNALRRKMAESGRSLNQLHTELLSLAAPGRELDGFAAAVAGFYADTAALTESTTTRAAAAMVQGLGRDPAISYIARLLTLIPLAEIDALDTGDRFLLMDPDQDVDGDTVSNGSELNRPAEQATHPDTKDSDGDNIEDGVDPCPTDPDNLCLGSAGQEDDADNDGIPDAMDNCMNTENENQQDSNADGIGDACVLYANIRTPAGNVNVWKGDAVAFTSIVTEQGEGRVLEYRWTFSGGAPDSTLADPGNISFDVPGEYLVQLSVEDAADHTSLGVDYRIVKVQGVQTFTVDTAVSAGQGSFDPETQTVEYNQTTSLNVQAASGYTVDTVSGCGGTWTGSNPYTTGPVTADCTVKATFEKQPEVENSTCTFYVFRTKDGNTVVICQ